jgi:hypothetical protein
MENIHKLCAYIFYSAPHKLHLMFCSLFSYWS